MTQIFRTSSCFQSSLFVSSSPRPTQSSIMSFPWQGERQDYYLPMINFDTVTSGIYRSGFPLPRNLPFIHKLGIKTILQVSLDWRMTYIDLSNQIRNQSSIYWTCRTIAPRTESTTSTYPLMSVEQDDNPNESHLQFPSNPERVNHALESIFSILLDRRNYPILINCLKGQVCSVDIIIICSISQERWWPASGGCNNGRCHPFLQSLNVLSDFICRFAHFEKKMRVYDMLVVELFKVHLTASPEYLPDWITVDEFEDMKVLLAN